MGMGKEKRIKGIRDFLEQRNGASIRTLAAAFNVSEMTIRRDLSVLQSDNLVKLVHGAAIYNGKSNAADDKKYEISDEKTKQTAEKMKIGKKAVSLIEPNDVIIIDTGTTAEFVAKLLPDDLPVTVICYTSNSLVELYQKPSVKIYFAGGYYHRNSCMFESPEGLDLINRIRASKAFVSAAGICQRLGVTCVNQYEIKTKQASLDSAFMKILLLDSSKFDRIRPAYFAELSDFDVLITDEGISPEWAQHIQKLNITLHTV